MTRKINRHLAIVDEKLSDADTIDILNYGQTLK
jgi:hypothetical protein